MPIEAYRRPPGFIFERLTIAILCNESLELHWQDEQSELSYLTRVFPHEIIAEDGADFLSLPTAMLENIKSESI